MLQEAFISTLKKKPWQSRDVNRSGLFLNSGMGNDCKQGSVNNFQVVEREEGKERIFLSPLLTFYNVFPFPLLSLSIWSGGESILEGCTGHSGGSAHDILIPIQV